MGQQGLCSACCVYVLPHMIQIVYGRIPREGLIHLHTGLIQVHEYCFVSHEHIHADLKASWRTEDI